MGATLCTCLQKGRTTDAVVDKHHSKDNLSGDNNGKFDNDSLLSGAFRYEDDEGSDLFFSARESFSQIVNELSYPPTSTRKLHVSIENPDSLLSQLSRINDDDDDDENDQDESDNAPTSQSEERIQSNAEKLHSSQRPSQRLKDRLQSKDLDFATGYPGELSPKELEACLEFRRRLQNHQNATYRSMVHLNVDASSDDSKILENDTTARILPGEGPEEEAFALCRFLRARDFNVDETFAMMDEHVDLFQTVLQNHNLHRSLFQVEDHVGCPLPIFTQQFPMVDSGVAKNGSFVVYMKAGKIRLDDGFDCISPARTPKAFCDTLGPMAWHICCKTFGETMHRLRNEQQVLSEDTTDFVVLAEAVFVMDLEGLPRSLFTTRTMEYIQQSFGIIQCFPEILNRVVVINVPRYFTLIWAVLKHFLDARTAQKIGFFSTLEDAQPVLNELIDESQLLVDYGGVNINFREALMLKLKRDGMYDRYLFEYYSSSSSSSLTMMSSHKLGYVTNILQTFELKEGENAEITVYTQAIPNVDGVFDRHFALLPETEDESKTERDGGSSSSIIAQHSSSPNKNDKAQSNSRVFGQPAALGSSVDSKVCGPGNFRLVVVIKQDSTRKSFSGNLQSSISSSRSGQSKRVGSIDRALVVVSIR